MLGLFGKKLSDDDFKHIIMSSRISPHVKDEELVAFMIVAEADPDVLFTYLQKKGQGMLLQLTEIRIREEEDFEKTHYVFKRQGWEPNLFAKRILVGNQQMLPICSWDVSVGQNEQDEIQVTTYPR